jgi:hypothetical protein
MNDSMALVATTTFGTTARLDLDKEWSPSRTGWNGTLSFGPTGLAVGLEHESTL